MPIFISTRLARFLAAAWTLGIVAALAWPSSGLPDPPSALPLDKIVHVGLFAGFGGLWMLGGRGPWRRRAIWVAGTGLLFAVLTEVGQGMLTTSRNLSTADALADALGVLLGIGACVLLEQRDLVHARKKDVTASEH